MKKAILIILAVALVIGIGLKIKVKIDQNALLQQTVTMDKDRKRSNVPIVKGVTLAPQMISETLKVFGEIQADTKITVQPRISGRLVTLLVNEGQPVRAGQLIAIMDDESIRIQLQQSEANIASLQANLNQSQINLNRAKTEKERYLELYNQKYISQRDFENVENAYLTAQASHEATKAQLTASRKNYELLKLQLNQTKVFSPINGYVVEKPVTVGANLTTGSTVVTVTSLNPVKLVFNIDQKDASKLRKGMGVSFTLDALPNQVFTGAINQVAPSFDPKTRSLSLTATLANRSGKLFPGMFGDAEVVVGKKENALVVPQEAIITQDNQNGVFVVVKKKSVEFRPVETGLVAEGQVEIITGLKANDLVVVIGQNRLRDGQEVQLMNGKKHGDRSKNTSNRDQPKKRNSSKAGGKQ